MSKIVWKNEYSVGVAILDKQHQGLVKLINRLSEEIQSGGMISYVFAELDQYVKEHFKLEEEMMRQASYKDFEPHKREHRDFVAWQRAVQQANNIGDTSSQFLAESVGSFLRDWLINHILKSDMAYVGQLGNKMPDTKMKTSN